VERKTRKEVMVGINDILKWYEFHV
jgi:hypothetical protein